MDQPAAPDTARKTGGDPYRVMVVDDSAVIRGLVSRFLDESPAVNVVTTAANGKLALAALDRYDIEVVILDIEMPVMDGMTALPQLLKAKPDLKVIMASTLTEKSAAISLKALSLGAADYIPKPSAAREVHGAATFRDDLLEKVIGLASVGRVGKSQPPASDEPVRDRAPIVSSLHIDPAKIALRAPSNLPVKVLAIGSSTGGPQALVGLFKGLNSNLGLPIFITQHMPPTFTGILAEHISTITDGRCQEGEDGELIEPNRIYLAPGGHHMVVAVENGDRVVRINSDPPENFCRPAVDPMFRSISKVYGVGAFGVILTGMGSDGAQGGKVLTTMQSVLDELNATASMGNYVTFSLSSTGALVTTPATGFEAYHLVVTSDTSARGTSNLAYPV